MSTKKPEELKAVEPKKEEIPEAVKPKFDKDELLAIFDEIMFNGEYTEEYLIKGKLKVVFRTKSASEQTAITRQLDGASYNLMTTLSEARALLNLAYSLVSYNGKDLSGMPVEERGKFVGKLPTVIVAAISEALIKFDVKTDAACAEGEENF